MDIIKEFAQLSDEVTFREWRCRFDQSRGRRFDTGGALEGPYVMSLEGRIWLS